MTENDYDNNEIQEVDDNEITEEQIQEPVIDVEKSKRTKKDRSPAQQAAFKKCLEARKKRAEEQLALKEKKDKMKEEVEEEVEQHIKQVKRKPKKKVVVEQSSDDEPEVIYIKKPKRRKAKKRVIVEESSDSEDEYVKPKKSKSVEKQSAIKKAQMKQEAHAQEEEQEEQESVRAPQARRLEPAPEAHWEPQGTLDPNTTTRSTRRASRTRTRFNRSISIL